MKFTIIDKKILHLVQQLAPEARTPLHTGATTYTFPSTKQKQKNSM
jgi:hypothetical protein